MRYAGGRYAHMINVAAANVSDIDDEVVYGNSGYGGLSKKDAIN